MSITILVKGKNKRYATRLSIRKTVSLLVGVSLVFLVSSRSTESIYENQIRLSAAKSGLKEQAEKIRQLSIETDESMNGVVEQLAVMQSQLSRLEAKTNNLATSSGISQDDFQLPKEMKVALESKTLISEKIDQMAEAVDFKIQQVTALESILLGLNIEQESKLAGRPISKGWLSSYYGVRKDPFSGEPAMHKGLDFAGEAGSKVLATGAGVVTWAGERFGYGHLVEIDHGNGVKTRYGHNETLNVSIGDVVTKGQAIALMGSSGRSTGPHVHYEVLKNNQQVDPLPYVYR